MIHAEGQHEALHELREGRSVVYRGVEIPAMQPNSRGNRTYRAARAWLLEHTGPIGAGAPAIGPTLKIRVTDDQVAEIDRRAEAQGVSRAQVVRDLLTEALR